jgi:hypothetical protein
MMVATPLFKMTSSDLSTLAPVTITEALYEGTISPEITDYYYHPKSQCNLIVVLETTKFHVPSYLLYTQSNWFKTMIDSFPNSPEIELPYGFSWSSEELAKFFCAMIPGYRTGFPFINKELQFSSLSPSYSYIKNGVDERTEESVCEAVSIGLASALHRANAKTPSGENPKVDWTTIQLCHYFECKELILSARSSILGIRHVNTPRYIEYVISCIEEIMKRQLKDAISPQLMFQMLKHHSIYSHQYTPELKTFIKQANVYELYFDADWSMCHDTIRRLVKFRGIFGQEKRKREEEDDDDDIISDSDEGEEF